MSFNSYLDDTTRQQLNAMSLRAGESRVRGSARPSTGHRARKQPPMLDACIGTVPFEAVDAQATAAIRAVLKIQGQPIGAYDVLIAGRGGARCFCR
jgi:predicted nucleic acid-binding protein